MNSSIILFIFIFFISLLISSCYNLLYQNYNKNSKNLGFYYNKYFIFLSYSFIISIITSLLYYFIIHPNFCNSNCNIIKIIDQSDSNI